MAVDEDAGWPCTEPWKRFSAGARRDISELQKDVAEIRRDIAERMATKGDVSIACNELRAEMHQGFGAVRTDFAAIIAAQTRSMVLLIFGSLLTITTIAFAAAGIR